MATTIYTIMKADLVLVISPEAPLMKQLGKVLGKLCNAVRLLYYREG